MVDNNTSLDATEHSSFTEPADPSGLIREQDRLLPIANVGRIMKQILPPSAKISKEAKETMQECASEFISFVTGEASERCQKEKRKTVNGDDVCWALGALGFDEFVEPLKMYLNQYREIEDQKTANCNNNRGGPSSSSLNNNDGGEAGSCQSEQGRYPMFLKFNVAEKINDNKGFISRRC